MQHLEAAQIPLQLQSASISSSQLPENFNTQGTVERNKNTEEETDERNSEPLDFENNGLLWLPPEPEDEKDDRVDGLFDYDDEDEDATGDWGYFTSLSSEAAAF